MLNGTYKDWDQGTIGLLVGGLEHVLFLHILGTIIPTDQYFSEGLKPPTRLIWDKGTLWDVLMGF